MRILASAFSGVGCKAGVRHWRREYPKGAELTLELLEYWDGKGWLEGYFNFLLSEKALRRALHELSRSALNKEQNATLPHAVLYAIGMEGKHAFKPHVRRHLRLS